MQSFDTYEVEITRATRKTFKMSVEAAGREEAIKKVLDIFEKADDDDPRFVEISVDTSRTCNIVPSLVQWSSNKL